jgi:hypothetical protein
MKRFTTPRVAHCSDGCRSQSQARRKTATTQTETPSPLLGVSVQPDRPAHVGCRLEA